MLLIEWIAVLNNNNNNNRYRSRKLNSYLKDIRLNYNINCIKIELVLKDFRE